MVKNKNIFSILMMSWAWIISGLLNYIYHPMMLKYLTIEEFWMFWSLTWMFNLIGITTTWIMFFLNKKISNNINNMKYMKKMFYKYMFMFFLLSFILYIMFYWLSKNIANFLHMNNVYYINMLWLSIFWFLLGSVMNATFSWLKQFKLLSLYSMIFPLLKLIMGFVLVFLWYQIYWAIYWFTLWLIISMMIGLIYFYMYFKYKLNNFWEINKMWDKNLSDGKKEFMNFFSITLLFGILMNIDMILAKNIFDEKLAWIYIWLSILSKFILYLLFSMETVYFSKIMEYKKEKLPFKLLLHPLLFMLLFSIFALLINYFFGEFILSLIKMDLSKYLNLYILMLMYYSLLAFMSFMSKVLIWWNKYGVNYLMLFLNILLIMFVYMFWNTLLSFIFCFLMIWTLWLLSMLFLFYSWYKI